MLFGTLKRPIRQSNLIKIRFSFSGQNEEIIVNTEKVLAT